MASYEPACLVRKHSLVLLSLLLLSLAGSRFWEERLNPCKLLFRAPGFPGNVRLDKVSGRYYPMSTGLTLVDLFNPSVLEQRAGVAPAGRYLNSYR